jgi:TM2 domain-containing membrane protein YozV
MSTRYSRPSATPKSLALAYLLWLIGGSLGAHRFYLGSPRVGASMIATLLAAIGMPGSAGWVLLIPLLVWTLLDALVIPALVRGRALFSGEPFPVTAPLAWFAIGAMIHIAGSFLEEVGDHSQFNGLPHIAGLGWSLFMASLPPLAGRGGTAAALGWALFAVPLHMATTLIGGGFGFWIVLAAHPTLCAMAALRHLPASGSPVAIEAVPPAGEPAPAPAARESGRAVLAAIASYAAALPDQADELRAISELGERILDEVERDPKSRPAVQRFLDYYLESAAKIIALHAKMAALKPGRAEPGLGAAIADIRRTFQYFLDRALDDDLADLDSELTVLRTKMRSEGIS